MVKLYTVIFAALMVALDQATKYLATRYLMPVGTMSFLPGVMQLEYVLNDGAAFSSFSGNRWLLIGVTSTALVAVLVYLLWKKPSDKREYWGWMLVLGGGLGNLVDRIATGVVVDFFSLTFMNFAVFNVADCFVCVGVAVLFWAIIRQEIALAKQKKQQKLQQANALAQETTQETAQGAADDAQAQQP